MTFNKHGPGDRLALELSYMTQIYLFIFNLFWGASAKADTDVSWRRSLTVSHTRLEEEEEAERESQANSFSGTV